MNNINKGMLFGLLGVSAFGLTLPVTRYVVPYLDPVFIGLGRAVVAALFAALTLVLFRQPLPNKQQWQKLAVVVGGVIIGFPVLSAWAMKYVPANHGGVVLGLLPLTTAIAGIFISRERPSWGFWLTGLVGSVLVVAFALWDGAGSLHTADWILFAALIVTGIGYAMGGQLAKELGGWQVICWALLLSLPFILIPAIVTRPVELSSIPASVWLGFLYLAIVSQFLGFFAWNKGLALGGIARVSQTQLLQPFITIVAASLLLGEQIQLYTLIFAALVVLAVAISKRMPIEQKS